MSGDKKVGPTSCEFTFCLPTFWSPHTPTGHPEVSPRKFGTAHSLDPSTHLETNVSILASALALGSADYSWRSEAICRDTDPELFFPVGTTGQALLQIDRAKQVCNECNVRVSCLEFALETNQDSGIWGGTSEEERRNIRRQIAARNRAAQQNRIAVAPAS
ncbi:MAG: hypothetical protein RLZZ368_786 [Actinomycetota bacterium]